MEYRYCIPAASALSHFVKECWQVDRLNTVSRQETIIPKGVVEMIFNFQETNDLYAQLAGEDFRIPGCFINGYHTHPVRIRLSGRQTFFGAVFHPAAIKALFGMPACEFANCCVDLTLVNASFRYLWYHLAEQNSFHDRITVFSDWLQKRFTCLTGREQTFNSFLAGHLQGSITVPELAGRLCYSPRQLSRKLQELTGMNTEQTLLYIKYLQAIHLMHHSQSSLTGIGYVSGFADQSHFIRTFKSFARLTPSEYRHNKSHIPGHLFKDVR